MGNRLTRVLVIDDDEVVLVAIADLLEASGFQVHTRTSPIGATQIIVREMIDAAIVDVNLPDIQGDNVIRLLRTWDKLKDLPVLLISGAEQTKLEQIRRELPGVQIVRKGTMHEDLVPVLRQTLAGARPFRPVRSSSQSMSRGGNDQSTQDPAQVARDMLPSFLEQLADAMILARDVCGELRQGRATRIDPLTRSLAALRRRALLLNLDGATRLLQALLDVLSLVKAGSRPSAAVVRSIEDALSALTGLRKSQTGEFAVSPDFLIQNLREAGFQLRAHP